MADPLFWIALASGLVIVAALFREPVVMTERSDKVCESSEAPDHRACPLAVCQQYEVGCARPSNCVMLRSGDGDMGCNVCGAAPGRCMTTTICQQEREARRESLASATRCGCACVFDDGVIVSACEEHKAWKADAAPYTQPEGAEHSSAAIHCTCSGNAAQCEWEECRRFGCQYPTQSPHAERK